MRYRRDALLRPAVPAPFLALALLIPGAGPFPGSTAWARDGGEGPGLVSERRPAGDFTRIEVAGRVDVDVRIGPGPSVTALARDEKDLRHIVTRIRGGRLVVDGRGLRGWNRKRHPLRVAVAAPVLEAVEVSGAGDLTVTGLDGGDLSVRMSGAGDATLTGRCGRLEVDVDGAGDLDIAGLSCRRLDLDVSGAGDIRGRAGERIEATIDGAGDVRLAGSCRHAGIRVRGAGDFRGRRLMCEEVDVKVSGAGDVTIGARGPVRLRRSGAGDITVLGDPEVREIEGSGAGGIHIRRSSDAGG